MTTRDTGRLLSEEPRAISLLDELSVIEERRQQLLKELPLERARLMALVADIDRRFSELQPRPQAKAKAKPEKRPGRFADLAIPREAGKPPQRRCATCSRPFSTTALPDRLARHCPICRHSPALVSGGAA